MWKLKFTRWEFQNRIDIPRLFWPMMQDVAWNNDSDSETEGEGDIADLGINDEEGCMKL